VWSQPGVDVVAVTAVQIREVVERLIVAGQWQQGDPSVLVVLDAGYDALRIAHLLADPPVEILGRMRSDHVLRRPSHLVHPPLRDSDRRRGTSCTPG
jgi:hypothetical protein